MFALLTSESEVPMEISMLEPGMSKFIKLYIFNYFIYKFFIILYINIQIIDRLIYVQFPYFPPTTKNYSVFLSFLYLTQLIK